MMIVKPIKTEKILPNTQPLFELLDKYLDDLQECSVLAVTSKIVSLCENKVVPIEGSDKEALIKYESDYYMPSKVSKYGYHFTITKDTLIAAAGIDESNGAGNYILWPDDPQRSANQIRNYLAEHFGLKSVGVVITDSTCFPFRWGTIGILLAHSGFRAVNNYVGQPDLFGRPFQVSRAGVGLGLAAAATVAMGEGTEQTPLALITDLPFVTFQSRNPTPAELKLVNISQEDDLFEPFLSSVKWHRGGKK